MTRVLAFALTILVLASSTVMPPTASSAPTTNTATEQQSCDWQETFHATLGMLGEDPDGWRVQRMDGYAGQVDRSGVAVVNPDIPCGYVETVVVHEWLHLRQMDRYGSWQATKAAAGSRLDAELVAECGTALLIDPVPGRHSYAAESVRVRGYGCTSWHVLEAAGLIAETAASTNEPPN